MPDSRGAADLHPLSKSQSRVVGTASRGKRLHVAPLTMTVATRLPPFSVALEASKKSVWASYLWPTWKGDSKHNKHDVAPHFWHSQTECCTLPHL